MQKIKLIGGALAVVLLVAVGAFLGAKVAPKSSGALGDQVQNDVFWFTNGIAVGSTRTVVNFVHLTMGSGQNQAYWYNNTGGPVKIPTTNVFVTLSQGASSTLPIIASTTLAISAGTSTTATITDKQTNPLYSSILGGTLIATSSPQSSFSNIQNGLIVGSNVQGMVRVAAGQYVVFALEEPYVVPGTCTGSICENATSTNRGYNIGIDFPYQAP